MFNALDKRLDNNRENIKQFNRNRQKLTTLSNFTALN